MGSPVPAAIMDSTLPWSSPYIEAVPCSVPTLTPLTMPLTPYTPLLTPTMVSPVDSTPIIGFCSPNLNVHRPTPMKLYRSHSEGTVGMPSTITTRKCAPKSQRRDTVNVSMPVTYTPATHRISKAKKGKRVHACQFPGCSKPTIGHKRRISQISDASDAMPMSSPCIPLPHSVPNSAQIAPITPELHSLHAAHSPYVNTQLLSPPYWTSFRRASDPSIGYSSVPYSAGDESSLFSSPECSRSPSSDSSHGAHFPFSTSHITGIGIFHEPMVDPTIMGTPLPYDSNFGGFQAVDSTIIQSSPLVTLPGNADNTRTVCDDSFFLRLK
ncbi:hypothetical protein MGYG_00964 [Nannizzia gypsea CBS 118893]|uniref:Uncharacterized protein n=1 Tax=Arthroderma gypseum (strain ATCC MYA-4604 / CBS 118893) TaxID=535722 RepID=E5R3B2_ARTGP|nr:hypothetical protein MGYG_00964 [Nannizzia gypsea CBS 118893]EFQ97927.1 hypothetical protein MGYG_00964 [Nannizzia gypsea CBS 118893]